MKLFLSLFLSACISLTPLYSVAESPIDLEPVYNIKPKVDKEELQTYLSNSSVQDDIISLLEEVVKETRIALNDSSTRAENFPELSDSEVALLNERLEGFDPEEIRAKLSDPSTQAKVATMLAGMDMENLQPTAFQESESSYGGSSFNIHFKAFSKGLYLGALSGVTGLTIAKIWMGLSFATLVGTLGIIGIVAAITILSMSVFLF